MKEKNPAKVGKVMGEFKKGELNSSSGDKVTNPKQAIAIGLSEAGMAKKKPMMPGMPKQGMPPVEKAEMAPKTGWRKKV